MSGKNEEDQLLLRVRTHRMRRGAARLALVQSDESKMTLSKVSRFSFVFLKNTNYLNNYSSDSVEWESEKSNKKNTIVILFPDFRLNEKLYTRTPYK